MTNSGGHEVVLKLGTAARVPQWSQTHGKLWTVSVRVTSKPTTTVKCACYTVRTNDVPFGNCICFAGCLSMGLWTTPLNPVILNSNPPSWILIILYLQDDRLCNLVIRVPYYKTRGLGFYCRRYQIFWEAVWMNTWRLRSRKQILTAVENRCLDNATSSTHRSWHKLRRQTTAARSV
jgi:hypothetical protein